MSDSAIQSDQVNQTDRVIQTDRLSRYFAAHAVVRDLNMQVPAGQVTALLGLNGAGKTTTIRIIMGLLRPTRGTCHVLGEDTATMSPETRRRIGYMVEGHFLYPSMRIHECERFQRAAYRKGDDGHWDDRLFAQIIQHFGIPDAARIGEISRGQRAGVALAMVLAPDPELLVLDDPALGLDPISRRALNQTLIEFAGNGKRTVLLSTHLLDDVERVADRVMVLVDGRLQVDAGMDEFHRRIRGYDVMVDTVDDKQLASIAGLIEARRIGDRLQLSIADADAETEAALNRLGATSIEPVELTFSDGVLAYLARQRQDISFLTQDRTGAAQ
ncbi:MAG: ABC transporter ATP-binding protein [Pirellulaceae bacterium]|nr:ABC transporter ATP-binding protein [Pirellulaceae bacterium]